MRLVFRIVPVQPIGVAEDCGHFFKRDTMFLEIGNGLGNVPYKHIFVYTLMCPLAARTEGADGLSGLSGFSSSSCVVGWTRLTR